MQDWIKEAMRQQENMKKNYITYCKEHSSVMKVPKENERPFSNINKIIKMLKNLNDKLEKLDNKS